MYTIFVRVTGGHTFVLAISAVRCCVFLCAAVGCCGLLWAAVCCCVLLWAAVGCCVLLWAADYVHVMSEGKIVRTGGKELALELEDRGYDWIKQEAVAS